MLVYIIVFVMMLMIFFDLSRIVFLGVIFYLLMDIVIYWGVLNYLCKEIFVNWFILLIVIILDLIVLIVFIVVKVKVDSIVIWMLLVGLFLIIIVEKFYFSCKRKWFYCYIDR